MQVKYDDVEKGGVGQEQIHDLLFEETLSWQSIIYDLINSEQLDPWNIDISLLSDKYLEKVQKLEEANFFISSKVLLAASLLLRIKSEIVLNHDIPGLDDILFGKKEERVYQQERIELDEDVPLLVPRTPLPRFRRVTLEELMSALGKAIKTETRRIKKAILFKQQEFETSLSLPKRNFNLKDQIEFLYDKIKTVFSDRDSKVAFSELLGQEVDRDKRIIAFVSLLHLDNQQRVWLEQGGRFEEIWVMLKTLYEKQNKDFLEKLKKEVEDYFKSDDRKKTLDEPEAELEEAVEMKIKEKKIDREDLDEISGFGKKLESL